MSADFSRLMQAISGNLEAHAERDGLSEVERAVFLARGGHAPGTRCPNEPPPEPEHHYWCEWPDDECHCGLGVRGQSGGGDAGEGVAIEAICAQ